MTAGKNSGTCEICKQGFSQRQMTNHLAKCTQAEVGDQAWFHIVVQGRYSKDYWLHLRVLPQASLNHLDGFLRDIWLECCDHLSEFRIGEKLYTSYPDETYEPSNMAVSIARVLEPGMEFRHTYDFGTSTELGIRVIAARRSAPDKAKVRLLARNHLPEMACNECHSAPAVQLCRECSWPGRGWMCDACATEHECGEEMLLPVVNSPRVGQCVYTGK